MLVTLTLVSTHISLFRTDGVRTSQQCVCIYTAVHSQTLTAISIFKYVNIVCIIQVHSVGTVAACRRRERLGARGVRASCCALATVSNSSLQPGACYCVPTEALCSRGPCVVLVCTVWYTAVCSSAVFVLFRMNSGPCLKH